MSADYFLDSNVLVYLFDNVDSVKQTRATSLVEDGIRKESGCISFQVVQETINVVTGKLGASPDNARILLDNVLHPLWRVQPTVELYRRSLEIRSRFLYSFYDCLILSAALEAGCRTLYTEDMQHGQEIERLVIVNPFLDENVIHDKG